LNKDQFKILLGYIIICLIWGSTWIAIKLGLDSLTPLISAGLRFTLASILIFVILQFRGKTLQKDTASIKIYFFLGYFSFVIPFWLVYWSEQFIPSGLASVLFAIFPFSVFIFSLLLLKSESVDIFKFISVVLGFVGVAIIFSDGLQVDLENHFIGLIAVLSSAIMQGLAAVIVKRWGGHLNPFSMNAPPLFIAGISMIILSLLFEDSSGWDFNFSAILSISYLAVFGTIFAFTIYYWLLQRINAVILSLSSFITPIIAVLLGWIFLDEILSQQVLVGTLFVLIGILFGNFRGLKKIYRSKKGIINA
jgi:drug/metabolite transporter (DMT)-like permease